jgi:hypothetical protein
VRADGGGHGALTVAGSCDRRAALDGRGGMCADGSGHRAMTVVGRGNNPAADGRGGMCAEGG